MQNCVEYRDINIIDFKQKLILWSVKYKNIAYYDSNNYKNINYDLLVGLGKTSEIILFEEKQAFDKLKEFYNNSKNWIFGYFSYDLKNDTESLSSNNKDNLKFPALHFFVPEYVFKIRKGVLNILSNNSEMEIKDIFNQVLKNNNEIFKKTKIKKFNYIIDKEEYISKIKQLKNHIQQGDIYEVNFCQEFYSENAEINPSELYDKLNKISPVPFSAFYKNNENYLISASPERFVEKKENIIISQPIKGTIKRGNTKIEDGKLIENLKLDVKERAENVMIVDLVRNDLSKIAVKNSVKVKELFGIYTFPQVHQMISTIEAKVSDKIHPVDIIKQLFPMGSMTGAPKISAMQIIEKYEETKRGLYSGAVGYFKPNGDFDFNVVIRSLLYNSQNKYLSFQVGGAITIKSDPEKEYEECLIKAKALLKATDSLIYNN